MADKRAPPQGSDLRSGDHHQAPRVDASEKQLKLMMQGMETLMMSIKVIKERSDGSRGGAADSERSRGASHDGRSDLGGAVRHGRSGGGERNRPSELHESDNLVRGSEELGRRSAVPAGVSPMLGSQGISGQSRGYGLTGEHAACVGVGFDEQYLHKG